MGKSGNILPPGPNPREDRMTEKDQEQLRRHLRGQVDAPARQEEETDEFEPADAAEGERFDTHEYRMRHTPGQAEGEAAEERKED